MKFIQMTGKQLTEIMLPDEVNLDQLRASGVTDDSIVRVNEQGDIEIRRQNHWDVIGGLLGEFVDRVKRKTGLDFV